MSKKFGYGSFSHNTVRSVGALLPGDVLEKVQAGESLDGLTPDAYGLADVRLRDVVAGVCNELVPVWWAFQRELADLPETDTAATTLTRENG